MSPQNTKGFLGNILILTNAVILASIAIPVHAAPAESGEKRLSLAQNEEQQSPIFVDILSTTQELVYALEHSKLKHQRRYAAELLGDHKDKEAIPALMRALRDPEEVVQKAVAEALAKLGDPSIFEELVANLSDPNPCVRKYSAYVLGRLAKKEDRAVVEGLESEAGDKDTSVRVEVIYALKEIGSPSSRDIFIQGLNDEDSRIRIYSATALGDLKGPDAGWALGRALEQETDEDVRRIIASALGKVGSVYSVGALVSALPNETPSVRADIASALGDIKSPEAVHALVRLLSSDSSPEVRSKAAIGLLKAKDPSTVHALADALKDRTVIVRRPASEALIYVADASVIDELVDALGDTDATVADNAATTLIRLNDLQAVHKLITVINSPNSSQAVRATTVLGEITHRPYGHNVEKWKEWYEENFKIGS